MYVYKSPLDYLFGWAGRGMRAQGVGKKNCTYAFRCRCGKQVVSWTGGQGATGKNTSVVVEFSTKKDNNRDAADARVVPGWKAKWIDPARLCSAPKQKKEIGKLAWDS
jgi:hypothetical protein